MHRLHAEKFRSGEGERAGGGGGGGEGVATTSFLRPGSNVEFDMCRTKFIEVSTCEVRRLYVFFPTPTPSLHFSNGPSLSDQRPRVYFVHCEKLCALTN